MFSVTTFTPQRWYSIELTDTKHPGKVRTVQGEVIGISHDIIDLRSGGGQRYSVPLHLIQAALDVT